MPLQAAREKEPQVRARTSLQDDLGVPDACEIRSAADPQQARLAKHRNSFTISNNDEYRGYSALPFIQFAQHPAFMAMDESFDFSNACGSVRTDAQSAVIDRDSNGPTTTAHEGVSDKSIAKMDMSPALRVAHHHPKGQLKLDGLQRHDNDVGRDGAFRLQSKLERGY